MKEKTDFIISSILDIQSTIRAIDNKLIAIIVFVLLPVSKLDVIVLVFMKHIANNPFVGYFLLFIFILFWVLSFIFSLLGILGLENPAKHIQGSNNLKGIFYNGDIYKIRLNQILFSSQIKSKKLFNSYLSELDLSKKNILKELVFEQFKLTFIRDLKMKRQRIAIISILFSTMVGLISWILILIKIYK